MDPEGRTLVTDTNVTEVPTDWRGTPIHPGALVIYGASAGRSVTLVEAIVDSFTKSGRVNLRVIRRSYGSYSPGLVHVGADRLTVVGVLPPTSRLTDAEASAESLRRLRESLRIGATHDMTESNSVNGHYVPPICKRCDASWRECRETECPSE